MRGEGAVKLPAGEEAAELEGVVGGAMGLLESNNMRTISKAAGEPELVAVWAKRSCVTDVGPKQ